MGAPVIGIVDTPCRFVVGGFLLEALCIAVVRHIMERAPLGTARLLLSSSVSSCAFDVAAWAWAEEVEGSHGDGARVAGS